MKKLLAAIISLAMCTAVFTACSKENSSDTEAAEVTSSAAETVKEAELTTAETTAHTTEAETEAEPENSYESLDDFIEEAFSLETKTEEGSMFSDYMAKNISGDGLYFDMKTHDGKMDMLLAFEDSEMCVKVEGEGESIYIYVIGETMYMLDASEKTGFSMALDQDTVDSLASDAMGGIDLESAASETEKSEYADVEIDGEEYIFQNLEEIGVLFHTDGEIYAVINSDADETVRAFLVNEMSSTIPEGILELPKDYEIIDMSELLAGLEDYDSGDSNDSSEPVKTEFATMEEFLEADFSRLEGTEYSAEESFSAAVVELFKSDRLYSSAIRDGEQLTVAIADGKVMLEGDFGGTGDLMKFIIIGDKFYAVNDSEKAVLIASSEEMGTAEELIEGSKATFANISLTEESPIKRAEVTVDGKKYFVESDNDRDSCLIFDENKELYAIVDDGEYTKWAATDKIPEGIFDIPSDYEVINIDDME